MKEKAHQQVVWKMQKQTPLPFHLGWQEFAPHPDHDEMRSNNSYLHIGSFAGL
jgi:hypothetical protein